VCGGTLRNWTYSSQFASTHSQSACLITGMTCYFSRCACVTVNPDLTRFRACRCRFKANVRQREEWATTRPQSTGSLLDIENVR
jgi:hypothetical protein